MASCEAARHIATLLDASEDKLTILCTSPLRNTPQSRIVLPLSAINHQRVKSAVDTIVGSNALPDQRPIRAAIECAMDMLTTATPPTCAYSLNPSSWGQIFLLTANPSELPQDMLHHANLNMHIICPGSVPWKATSNVDCNGWKLRSLYRNELEFVSRERDTDKTSLFNRLETVITVARRGIMSGRVTDLVLKVNSGTDCSIVGVIGKKFYSSLRPGEVNTALIKVNVGALLSANSSTPFRQGTSTPQTASDLFNEIHQMLGESEATLLTAELQYSHSLFPRGTKCKINADALVKQRVSGGKLIRDSSNQATPAASISKEWVQKRLIFYLATLRSPWAAISLLSSHFDDGEYDLVCPEYFGLVMEELTYQARIVERLGPHFLRSITIDDEENLYEHFGQGLFDIPDYKPQGWLPGAANDSEDNLDDDLGQTSQNLEQPNPGQGFAVVYDPHVEGEFLTSGHKALNSMVPKTAGRAWIPDTSDDDADDDGSDKSTVIGPSNYKLNNPSSKASNNKPCVGFSNVSGEVSPTEHRPRRGFVTVQDENSPFGNPTATGKANNRTDTRRAIPINVPTVSSAYSLPTMRSEYNIPAVRSAYNIPAVRSTNLHRQAGDNSFDRDQPTPTPSRVHQPQAQSLTMANTPSQNPNAPLSAPTDGAEGTKGSKSILRRFRKLSFGDSQKQPFVGRPTRFPQVIIVKDDRERMEVMRNIALQDQNEMGQSSQMSLLTREGSAGMGRGRGAVGGAVGGAIGGAVGGAAGGAVGAGNRVGSGNGAVAARKPYGRGAGGGTHRV